MREVSTPTRNLHAQEGFLLIADCARTRREADADRAPTASSPRAKAAGKQGWRGLETLEVGMVRNGTLTPNPNLEEFTKQSRPKV